MMTRWLALGVLCCWSFALADDGTSSARSVTVKVVDADDQPVAGAEVGVVGRIFKDEHGEMPRRYISSVESDEHGIANYIDDKRLLSFRSLFARHHERQIAAAASIDPTHPAQTVKLILTRETHVSGTTTVPPATADQHPFVAVSVHQGDRVVLDSFNVGTRDYALQLPAGEYVFYFTGPGSYRIKRNIVVARQCEPLQLDPIELPPTKISLLQGNAAPEIPGIIAWKNSEPTTLSDLRGRVVLLDFWGYWCGPCVQSMPKLFALHDKYAAQGLTIISIHVDLGAHEDDPVDSVEKLDARLIDIRRDLWEGRDVPFAVALASGMEAPLDAEGGKTLGAASAAYGVTAWPTYVLIDRRGNVVGRFYPNEKGITQVEAALAEQD